MKKIANSPVKEVRAKGKPERASKPRRKPLHDIPGDSKIPGSDSASGSSAEIFEAEKKPTTNQDAQNLITNQGTLNQADKITEN